MCGDAGANARSFILALDIGTTNVRCLVVNSSGIIAGKAHQKVQNILTYILNNIHFFR